MLSSFKKQERRSFNYKPRYYDKSSEEIKKEKMVEGQEPNVDFSDRFHRKVEQKRQVNQSSMRKLLVMIALLALLLYFLMS